MYDELMSFSEEDLAEIKNPNAASSVGYQGQNQSRGAEVQQGQHQPQNQSQNTGYGNGEKNMNQNQGNSYGNSNQGSGNGGYNNNNQGSGNRGYGNNSGGGNRNYGGGGGGGFKRKEEVIEDPYVPVSVYIDRDFPPEIKQRLVAIASKLIAKGITVRYNGDDKDAHEALSNMSKKLVEVYVPWRNFNEVDTKHYWNTKTSMHLAQTNFFAWDKIPDAVKSMLARNVRMIFGDKNNSICSALITWSPDGATKAPEVTKDTGRSSFIIKLAATYHFPVINLGKEGSETLVGKVFDLDN